MKTTIQITFLCVLSFCLLGCRSSSQPDTIESITDTFTPAPQSASATVVAPTIHLSTATKRSTATLTITPTLVQIPKSTFDASQAMIQTPFPPVQCPLGANISLPDLDSLNKSQDVYEKTIVEILNAGGIENIIAILSKSHLYDLTRDDLTHDGVPELITENRYNIRGYVSVFGCDTGQYKKMLTVNAAYDYAPSVMKIRDMNLNGVPDLALVETTCHYCTGVMVYEWDGQAFQSLIREWFIDTSLNELTYYPVAELAGYSDAEINDTDGNGTYEIILKGGFPSSIGDAYLNGPYRSTAKIFMWDGKYFSKYSQKYSPPEYRFQAIQDGDNAALLGDYNEALTLYQDAIFNDKLKGWSAEERENLIAHVDVMFAGSPTPTPLPPHNEDYSQLAAYARYRIMLLHLINGFQKEAKVVYDTLQEKFPEGNEGYPYAEMAKLVWNNFSNTNDISLACQQAVNYAVAHPEILNPLSGPEFGFWSKSYQPEDVCPY